MKKVRFGVVGTNKISDWVIEGGRQDSRFELSAVCSRTQERAEEFAAKHQIPYTFTSLEDMASSDKVDVIYIATPNCCHAAQAVLCMNHGKHVLCEKPFASNAEEVRSMIDAAIRNDVCLMEAMISTCNPNFLAAKAKLDKIGRIRRYFASFCQYSSRYDKFREGVVLNAFKPEYSNGACMDVGIYTIYPMIALFGKPQKIEAQGLILISGVDGQGAVNFQYENMNATVIYSKIADSVLPTEIEGEDGTILLDRIHISENAELIPRKSSGHGRYNDNERISLGGPLDKSPYYYEVKEFIDIVLEGRRESQKNSWSNSLATIEVIDEIRSQLGVRYPSDK